MRKKVLSMLVSLVLCFSTLPTAALAETADATAEKAQNGENITDIYIAGEEQDKENGYIAEQTAHTHHPICGDENCTKEEHKLPGNAEWVGVSTLDKSMAAGYYYLTDDIELGMAWAPRNDVRLCLNGHTITNKQTAHAIELTKVTVTLCDCDTQNRGAVKQDYPDGSGVYLNEAVLELHSGTITGRERGVYLAQSGSTVNMYGGKIKNSGTGVYMTTKGNLNFNMYGGTITENGAGKEDVGGVYVGSGTFRMSGNAKITNNNQNDRVNGAGGVYMGGGIFEMSGDAEISDNTVTIKESSSKYYISAGAGGVYVKSGTFKMNDNAKVTGNTVINNSSKDASGGVYMDANTMTVSGNVSVTGNTGGNVYLTADKFITVDALGETAEIGVRIPAIAEGSSATVATGAKAADLDRFSDDSGNNYKKNYADGKILFISEPHEHPICGKTDCTETGHGNAIFSALNTAVLGKTANGYNIPEGNWYLTENLSLDAPLCITGNSRLCLNGYSITATAAVDAIVLANGSALTLCDCRQDGKVTEYGAITHASGVNGRGIYISNGSFTMYGGKICSNTLSGDDSKGAGVYVETSASYFNMYGGTVSDNSLSGNNIKGAGICNYGTTTIGGNAVICRNRMNKTAGAGTEYGKDGGGIFTGGTLTVEGDAQIINNQTSETAGEVIPNSHGGGIYVSGSNAVVVLRENAQVKYNQVGSYGAGICVDSDAKLSVSDNVQVTDNEEFYTHGAKKTSNVFFNESDFAPIPITVTGALDNTARIGVRLNSTLLNKLSFKGINTVTVASAAENLIKEGNFVSDDSLYVIGVTENGTKAVLSKHQHTWKYTASGTTIAAECSECGKNGGSVTINAPADSSLTYDGKEKEATLEGNFTTDEGNPTISYTSKDETVSYNVPSDAGDYKASITAGGVKVSVDYNIKKAELTVTANENTVTYGDAPVANGVTYRGFVNGEDESVLAGSLNYTFSYDPRYGDAGLYIITPGGLTADNYEIDFVPGTMTVTPREVTLAWNNTENRAYGDGKFVSVTAGNLVNGDEISVDVTGGDKTETGTYTATATGLTGGKAGNYKLPDDTSKRTVTYSVGKGKLANIELTMPVYKGVSKEYTYDFSKELPILAAGLTFGKIQYTGTLSDDFNERWISKGNVVLNGSILSITTNDWDEGTQILEYVVTVKSDNYEDFTMTLKVNAEDKKRADLSIDMTGWSYGSGGFNEPVVLNKPADAKWVSTVYKNKATGKEIIPNGKTDDAGEYTVTVRYESDDTVYIGEVNFIIKPRHLFKEAVVVPAGVTTDKIYDGTTVSNLTEMSIAKDRLVTEEDGALRIVGTSEYANANAGATRLAFTTDGTIRLSDSSSSAKPSNYSTSPTNFTALFTANILQRELAFTADSVSKIHGSEDAAAEVSVSFLPVSGEDKTGLVNGETLVQGVDYDVTAVFSKSEAGEDNNVTVTVTLKDTEKARNYTLSSSEIITTGRIKPKPAPVLDGDVTLTPAEITYGEPLSKIKIDGTMKDPITNATVEGTFSWQLPGDTILDASALGHNVGWKFTPKDGKTYTETTGIMTVKIDKAQQYGKVSMAGYTYGQTPNTPTLTDRTGDMNAQVTYYYISVDGGTPQTWNINTPPELNAGTYHMYARIGNTNNYYGFEAVYCEFAVTKATPDFMNGTAYTKPTGLTATYGQTLGDIMLSNPAGNLSGIWNWMDSNESVGDASTATKTFKAKFTPTDKINYNMVENIELEITVNKADGNNLKTEDLSRKYTYTSEYTYTPDWSGLPSGQTWSYNSEYSVSDGSNAKLTKQDFEADGSLLTYAVSGGKPGDVVTVTLKASCNNYKDFTVTLHITLADRDAQAALFVTGDNTVVYGQTLTLSNDGGSGTGDVTYTVTNGTGEATIDPKTGILTPVKVGTVTVTATKAGDNEYNEITSAPFEITIAPATPTGEPKYTVVHTRGKTLNDAALTADGSTLEPKDGTLEWLDTEGNVLPNDTVVEANKIYTWRFTPANGNYTALTGEATLYAYTPSGGSLGIARFTVSFDTNGGSELSNQTVTNNSVIKEPETPTKEGFDFAGWYTDKELKEKYDFSEKVTKNLTLYAAWTEKDNSENQIILTIGEKTALVFGQTKTNDVAPKIANDRTMLPARFVAENLGADVLWNGDKELVTIKGKHLKTSEDITILIYIGSDIAYVNGKEIKLDSAAFVENDRTYTPVRFISEELGASVQWIESEQKVVITK